MAEAGGLDIDVSENVGLMDFESNPPGVARAYPRR
jgi:hypothetical protein